MLNLPLQTDWHPTDPVEDFLLDNAWMNILGAVQHTPYFARYMRSSSPVALGGKQLPRIIAERFLILSSRLEHEIARPSLDEPGRQEQYKHVAGNSLLLLGTVLALSRTEPSSIIPPQIMLKLSSFLRRWKARHKGTFLGSVSARVHHFLSARLQRPRSLQALPEGDASVPASQADSGTEVVKPRKFGKPCSLPLCDVNENLRQCGRYLCFHELSLPRLADHPEFRCKTVRYVGFLCAVTPRL